MSTPFIKLRDIPLHWKVLFVVQGVATTAILSHRYMYVEENKIKYEEWKASLPPEVRVEMDKKNPWEFRRAWQVKDSQDKQAAVDKAIDEAIAHDRSGQADAFGRDGLSIETAQSQSAMSGSHGEGILTVEDGTKPANTQVQATAKKGWLW